MEIKPLGHYNHLGLKKTISMVQMGKNLNHINTIIEIYRYMYPTCKDMVHQSTTLHKLMNDMDILVN
jgi:hypothetical protein